MSISVVVDVHCDCGHPVHDGRFCGDHTNYGDAGTARKGAIRKVAKEDGWGYYHAKDFCPRCVRDGHHVQPQESVQRLSV